MFELLDNPQIQSALQTIILTIIVTLGGLVTALIGFASKKALRWLEGKAHASTFECAIGKLTTITQNAVDEVEQTLVRQLKADNKWNADTAKEARDTAVGIAKRHLGEDGLKELAGCLGHAEESLEGMFRTYVEKHVRAMGTTNGKSPVVAMGE